jgi:hypothetical protein
MAKQRFKAELRPSGRGGGGHVVEVPNDVIQALGGGGRIPVNASFNGIPYRGSIVRMGGPPCIGVLKAIVEETGVDYGDTLDVVVERDTEERTIDPPPDLKKALATTKPAAAGWDKLSFTRKRELARGIEEAKRPETKARRLAAAIAELLG